MRLDNSMDKTNIMARSKKEESGTAPTLPAILPSIWDTFFGRNLYEMSNLAPAGQTLPAINVSESDEDYLVEMAAPGMKKGDFHIELENHALIVSSGKEETTKADIQRKPIRQEFDYRSFQRTITLPNAAEEEKITAKYSNGILQIVIPKKEQAKKQAPRTIRVK